MKKAPFFVLAAVVIFASLVGMACKLPSITVEVVEVSIEVPPPNGETVVFEVGEEKYFSDGEYYITLLYEGDGNWTCSDWVQGEICNNFNYIVGAWDPNSLNAIHLLGEWHQVEEIPEPPLLEEQST